MLTREALQEALRGAAALQQAGRLPEALDAWRAAVVAAPQSPQAQAGLGGALLAAGEVEAAEAAVRGAVQLAPGLAWPHHHLGRLLGIVGRLDEAAKELEQGLALDPADRLAMLDLGYVRLAQGDYRRGWPLYEARKAFPGQNAAPPPLPHEWAGESLAGRSILLWPEQGFGDQIQFVRFAPVLAGLGAKVMLAAEPPLASLFASLGVEVLPRTEPMTLPVPDHWALYLSVPGRLGATLETLPAAPYLEAPPAARERWSGEPVGGVGFAWRGRATHPNDAQRSLPSPDLLAPLATAGARLVDLTEPVGDFADLAARIERLDLVVTVDTALAHLAGALGKPCFVMLPWLRTDWRWLRDRTDSPWYPSLRLFRQPALGDWTSVIGAVTAAYEEFRP